MGVQYIDCYSSCFLGDGVPRGSLVGTGQILLGIDLGVETSDRSPNVPEWLTRAQASQCDSAMDFKLPRHIS